VRLLRFRSLRGPIGRGRRAGAGSSQLPLSGQATPAATPPEVGLRGKSNSQKLGSEDEFC